MGTNKLVVLCAMLPVAAAWSCRTGKQEATGQQVPAAEVTLSEALRHSLSSASAPLPDSLLACEAYGGGDPQLALARFRVLGSAMHADTAVVRAEVVSVADVRLAADGPYEVRQRVRTDTLSWSLLPLAESGRWGVCGYSREGVGFVRLQYLQPPARWLNGASLASVQDLADSLAIEH